MRYFLPALIVVALAIPVFGDDDKSLEAAAARKKIEAQRVETEFNDGRVAAYRLVRSDSPKLDEATEKLQALQDMIEKDTSLSADKRKLYLVTIAADLKNVREIAAERSRPTSTARAQSGSATAYRNDTKRDDDNERKGRIEDIKSSFDQRKDSLRDSKDAKRQASENRAKMARDTERSAIPQVENVSYPKDWRERTAKRSSAVKMTAKEAAIMKALNKTIDVEFKNNSLGDVLAALTKETGIDFAPDKLGLQDAGVSYETTITYKGRATTRSVIKRILADLNLGYYIEQEALQITSTERARKKVSARTYYIGDLAAAVDYRMGPFVAQYQIAENVARIVTMIKQVDSKSWKDNDPDAEGTIDFYPATMTLVIKQTAEFHFMNFGK